MHSGLNCLRGCIDGDPTSLPSRPSVRNNAFGVTLCIVASWLLCRPSEAAGKNRIQLFEALSQNRTGTCSRIVPRSTVIRCPNALVTLYPCVRSVSGEPTATMFVQPELRLRTFVARTDFPQAPRVVRTSAGDKLLVIAAAACCRRRQIRAFQWPICQEALGGVSLGSCSPPIPLSACHRLDACCSLRRYMPHI